MKKLILILTIIFVICIGSYYFYWQSDQKLLKDFAFEVTDDEVKFEKIMAHYIKCKKESKPIVLFFLKLYREEFKKNPGAIKVYSYNEAIKLDNGNEIVSDNYDKVYFIYLNEKARIPILLNNERKIIALSILNKGGTRFFLTVDGGED